MKESYSSLFEDVKEAPKDPILGVKLHYLEDKNPKKVNLGIGAFRTDEGKPYKLKCVKKAEEILLKENLYKEYLPQQGSEEFIGEALKLLYGKEHPSLGNMVGVQALSGTGGLMVGMHFLREMLPNATIYFPTPTWGNHFNVSKRMGWKTGTYRYYNPETLGINIDAMVEDLENMPEQSVVLLHMCAHNPTGVDPTVDQWKQIIEVFDKKRHVAFFDAAYQGFTTGNLDEDAAPIRLMATHPRVDIVCAQSFSKNMGLYGERVGCLSMLTRTPQQKVAVKSRLKQIIRSLYSSPPLHGARIAHRVLSNPELRKLFEEEVSMMSERIHHIRHELREQLVRLKTPGNWDHITRQRGMFTFTGLTPTQVEHIVENYSIYLLSNGRISLAGLNDSNLNYVADAIDYAVRNIK